MVSDAETEEWVPDVTQYSDEKGQAHRICYDSDEEEKVQLELSDNEFDDFEDAAGDGQIEALDMEEAVQIDGSFYQLTQTPFVLDVYRERVALPCVNAPD